MWPNRLNSSNAKLPTRRQYGANDESALVVMKLKAEADERKASKKYGSCHENLVWSEEDGIKKGQNSYLHIKSGKTPEK